MACLSDVLVRGGGDTQLSDFPGPCPCHTGCRLVCGLSLVTFTSAVFPWLADPLCGITMDIFTHDQSLGVSAGSIAELNDFPKVTFDTTTDLSGFTFFDASNPIASTASTSVEIKKEDVELSELPGSPEEDYSLEPLLLPSDDTVSSPAEAMATAPEPTLVTGDASSSTSTVTSQQVVTSLSLPSSSSTGGAIPRRTEGEDPVTLVSSATSSKAEVKSGESFPAGHTVIVSAPSSISPSGASAGCVLYFNSTRAEKRVNIMIGRNGRLHYHSYFCPGLRKSKCERCHCLFVLKYHRKTSIQVSLSYYPS